METPSILPILKNIPIFADLSEQDHKEIIANIVLNYFPVGYQFFKEGDAIGPDSAMYIIKHGMVKISRKDPLSPTDKELAVLADNNFFGEMALVLEEPRNASAVAVSESEVFVLKKSDFTKLMETSPIMAQKVSQEFLGREKQNNRSI